MQVGYDVKVMIVDVYERNVGPGHKPPSNLIKQNGEQE
jgi:hypothetical protein